jgi:glycosyltransferase involved in cell wall biosynthesis
VAEPRPTYETGEKGKMIEKIADSCYDEANMLSIVIPTYNEAEFLPILLESIKKQTFKDYEVIVADAKSTDKTREIAGFYGCTVVDGGSPSVGRNRGADAAKGDIILFLDADVVLERKDFLKTTVWEFQKKDFAIATCIIVPMSDKKLDKYFHKFYNNYTKILRPFLPHAPGFCIFVKKSIHERIGGFDEKIKLAEDHDYAIRSAKCGKFGILESAPLSVSVRRFERDGRLSIACKYFLCEIYTITGKRVRTNLFNYTFGYSGKDVKKL